MTKEIYHKLWEELGREPTEEEITDQMADLIDSARQRAQEEQFEKKPEY